MRISKNMNVLGDPDSLPTIEIESERSANHAMQSSRIVRSIGSRVCSLFCAVVLVLAIGDSAGATEAEEQPTLYERLGGQKGVEFIVENTLERHLENPKLAPYFVHLDHAWFRKTIVEFFATGTGGPATYSGADMRTAHAHLNISDEIFDLAMVDALAAVKASGATKDTQDEVAAIFESFRSVVVTQATK
ncbi:group I truncated hemoglobin [Pelagicoccus mobilis]|uniref:Group 1 truncated hemoglobin n=1 Tax=Pelagicoccus mobilis TaxID=415221 RepID=A0A934S5Q0_9BACT|nr:group 1 truncated hemoglobin [Pelagicoccus mobilis]MBK1880242.1 group 1 truncated hemoglobin [Pelagicoccus mobilis]